MKKTIIVSVAKESGGFKELEISAENGLIFSDYRRFDYVATFVQNDYRYHLIFETEQDLDEWLALLDGETITADDFNEMCKCGQIYCANFSGDMADQSANRYYIHFF